ncbi:uncharacterized protein K489DRAFT_61114 [Dissoconium aciculare CBS 342.82]|uniref:Uncharacterized protein n=1 Tax=Dissoconium aciculare CBS 342.82 TaxID=1314786 RepID=A0A6J3LVU7_9PEZI|nr:uncharacterized protein K489DRAFT_61114 [Dissoconium aciculare CBS 342.82]KAF1819886.1 hypothetical protein K489DRAFT_61114 [Dissoconium aciculare CBS 342.82]
MMMIMMTRMMVIKRALQTDSSVIYGSRAWCMRTDIIITVLRDVLSKSDNLMLWSSQAGRQAGIVPSAGARRRTDDELMMIIVGFLPNQEALPSQAARCEKKLMRPSRRPNLPLASISHLTAPVCFTARPIPCRPSIQSLLFSRLGTRVSGCWQGRTMMDKSMTANQRHLSKAGRREIARRGS